MCSLSEASEFTYGTEPSDWPSSTSIKLPIKGPCLRGQGIRKNLTDCDFYWTRLKPRWTWKKLKHVIMRIILIVLMTQCFGQMCRHAKSSFLLTSCFTWVWCTHLGTFVPLCNMTHAHDTCILPSYTAKRSVDCKSYRVNHKHRSLLRTSFKYIRHFPLGQGSCCIQADSDQSTKSDRRASFCLFLFALRSSAG